MRSSSTVLIVLVSVSIMAVTGSAFSSVPVKKIAENTPEIGQIGDNITKPLNQGEEHINMSITMVESSTNQPKYISMFIFS